MTENKPLKLIWENLGQTKVRVVKKDMQLRRGIIAQGEEQCPPCSMKGATAQHLFLQSRFPFKVWCYIVMVARRWVCPPSLICLVQRGLITVFMISKNSVGMHACMQFFGQFGSHEMTVFNKLR